MKSGLESVGVFLFIVHLIAVFVITISSWVYGAENLGDSAFLHSSVTRWVSTGYLSGWALLIAFMTGYAEADSTLPSAPQAAPSGLDIMNPEDECLMRMFATTIDSAPARMVGNLLDEIDRLRAAMEESKEDEAARKV